MGQHGGNYGMSTFSFIEEHEYKTADKWLSWGFKDSNNLNIEPIGNFRLKKAQHLLSFFAFI